MDACDNVPIRSVSNRVVDTLSIVEVFYKNSDIVIGISPRVPSSARSEQNYATNAIRKKPLNISFEQPKMLSSLTGNQTLQIDAFGHVESPAICLPCVMIA